ncbi:MAG: D-glycero-alpha-D-manno-heptose 1-phosphate guanylyltransferase [Chlamydiales bacterium]|nr:D-glycero-alpha-D-manno-heptose 1-phosphate guanylyltransferase [Chlamydiales bacterium]MCH9619509.1 D-glycero-alpha-D-manno-heptose 1-phosphate guanylyltransferase [Chlamydiales bacterium]MCH9622313.1 D-glycero-alpha-D-manno-heptose 1-phosphate guanylyltransferase [Chlamydiales bacterium]
MDAIVLAGGLGTRLRKVIHSTPKPLAPINGRPFLDLLLDQIATFPEIKRVILATGFLAEQISSYYKGKSYPFSLHFSQEASPLGTGGALRHALSLVESSDYFVFNGDSFLEVDFEGMKRRHQECKADITIACRWVEDISPYGEIELNGEGKILTFREKSPLQKEGLINGGIYLISRSLPLLNQDVFSLENDFFPTLLNKEAFGYPTSGKFIDIGTKESYTLAQEILA